MYNSGKDTNTDYEVIFMKLKIGICIFLAILIILLLILPFFMLKGNQQEKKSSVNSEETETIQEDTIANAIIENQYEFIIFEKNQQLIVYLAEDMSFYMETGIQMSTLPKDVREDLADGIPFENEKELFDFLESYSS